MNTLTALQTYAGKPEIASAAISHAGGPAVFARVIGLSSRWRLQRVDAWRKRGFPLSAMTAFPAILPLCEAANKAKEAA